jgi:hypothetical protein
MSMTTRDLVLNIAVNMGRLGRWAYEGKRVRVEQFLRETGGFVDDLEKMPRSPRFEKTFVFFKKEFLGLRNERHYDAVWAETAWTWADILTHRAQLT